MDGRTLSIRLTRRMDRAIKDRFESRFGTGGAGWSIVAVGGYGRRELCLFSDIDLLFLTHRKTAPAEIQKALKELLYPLWDGGYTLSYSVRTIKQAFSDTKKDFFFKTSLLDARLVCGSLDLFHDLNHAMSKDRNLKDTSKFLKELNAHVKKRHDKFGDASYHLEPDIKEGTGGLRDYHCLMWVLKAASYDPKMRMIPSYLSPVDQEELEAAVDHLLKIRYCLHEISGRRNDRLYFEHQGTLAKKLGYKGNGYESGAELFMRDFHRSALTVKSLSEVVLSEYALALGPTKYRSDGLLDNNFSLISGRISFNDRQKAIDHPEIIIDVFAHMSSSGKAMSNETRHRVRNALGLIPLIRQDMRAKESFMRALTGKHPAMALTAMLETGVLERFIPEFEYIKGRTHFDVYHTYTTDIHSIKTVEELRSLENEEPEPFVYVTDKEVLYLSALLHDIGKGVGRPHAVTGAPVAHGIAQRLGFSERRADMVGLLVRQHLLLPETAYKRDLSEEKTALICAKAAREDSTLAMLYLLSVADSRATGPRAWDEWKAALLQELYLKAHHSLIRGILRDPMNMRILEQRWERLINEVPSELGSRQAGRLWSLPQAYILHSEIDTIKRHLEMSTRGWGTDSIAVDVREKGEHVSVTIIAKDRPGLFALLTGILTINYLDIISATIFTWLDGIAVDEFTVLTPWREFTHWERITEQFKCAANGSLDINERISSTRPLKDASTIQSSSAPVIRLQNNSSDFFSVIEVNAPRRFGALFHIARTISGLKLDIHRAFISHTGETCTDVFYVVDELGCKITDEGFESRIIFEITKAITILSDQ